MTGKIFINYRRGDDPGYTGRLFDRLQDVFQADQLFLDVDNIPPGVDFVRVLNERVADSDIVLAVIGKNWIDARDRSGARRLDDPDDFVRIELTSALGQDKRVIPVLVGGAQMPRPEDLPEALQPLARRNAVRLTHERFRSDVQGLITALQGSLKEIEAEHEADAEAKRRARAEAERKEREAEAARLAAEEERRRLAEREAAEHAAAQRKREEAEARLRAEAERAFSLARRSGTVLALDGFLAAHGASAFAEEAQRLRAALLTREAAYRSAAASGDATVLRSFIATYSKGVDVADVRKRLRRVEPQGTWRRSAAFTISAIVAISLAAGYATYQFAIKSSPFEHRTAPSAANAPPVSADHAGSVSSDHAENEARDQAAWDLVKETSDEEALKRFIAEYPTSPHRNDAEARIAALAAAAAAKPAPPRPDEVAWVLLKQTTDEGALKAFIAQYPDSPLRKDAEARITAIETARAAEPKPPSPEEVAWNLVKDSTDPDEFRRFVKEFPASKMRPQAEQKVATLTAAASHASATPPVDPHALALSLQFELKRVGCFSGSLSGDFDEATRAAEHKFAKLASIKMPEELSPDAVKAVRAINKRICPLVCGKGERADGDHCVAAAPVRRTESRKQEKTTEPHRAANAAPASRGNGKCFSFGGRSFCE